MVIAVGLGRRPKPPPSRGNTKQLKRFAKPGESIAWNVPEVVMHCHSRGTTGVATNLMALRQNGYEKRKLFVGFSPWHGMATKK
jgi:hypothetical protein